MLTKTVPDFKKNVRTKNYNIPSEYSKNMVQLLSLLLEEEPEDRPSAREIFNIEIIKNYFFNVLSEEIFEHSKSVSLLKQVRFLEKVINSSSLSPSLKMAIQDSYDEEFKSTDI